MSDSACTAAWEPQRACSWAAGRVPSWHTRCARTLSWHVGTMHHITTERIHTQNFPWRILSLRENPCKSPLLCMSLYGTWCSALYSSEMHTEKSNKDKALIILSITDKILGGYKIWEKKKKKIKVILMKP